MSIEYIIEMNLNSCLEYMLKKIGEKLVIFIKFILI